MASNTKLNFVLIFLPLLTLFSQSQSQSTNQTVYEILPQYDLPSGLFPDSVTNYTFSDDGKFEVFLKKACYIEFDYEVYYQKKITGKLSLGSITNLQGIQVQRFHFMRFDVDEIRVDLPPSDSIYFTVGIIYKKLGLGQFKTVRSCKDKALTLRNQLVQFPMDDVPMLLTE